MQELTHIIPPPSVFSDAGLDLSRPVVTMCNSGMSSCSLALALIAAGGADVAVYHVSTWLTCSQ